MKDFDLFFQSQKNKKKRVKFKIFNEEYSIAGEMSAAAVLQLSRLNKESENGMEDDPEKVFKLAHILFGKDNVDRWIELDISIEELSAVIQWAFKQYNLGSDPEDEGEEKSKKK